MKKQQDFFAGMKASLPVFFGYLAVSFGFGALAADAEYGLGPWRAALMSLTNVTSAGQFAALEVLADCSPLWVLILTQFVINSRYALMSLALSQKLGGRIGTAQRLVFAFYNTDEIFAIAMSRDEPLSTAFLFGLGPLPILGWTGGTLFGALACNAMPLSVQTALGVALYGMFIAIVLPKARNEKSYRAAALLGAGFSTVFAFGPFATPIPSGLAIVIATVLSAALCAWWFPIDEKEQVGA